MPNVDTLNHLNDYYLTPYANDDEVLTLTRRRLRIIFEMLRLELEQQIEARIDAKLLELRP